MLRPMNRQSFGNQDVLLFHFSYFVFDDFLDSGFPGDLFKRKNVFPSDLNLKSIVITQFISFNMFYHTFIIIG